MDISLLSSLPSFYGYNKEEIVDILLREEYGYLPSAPHSLCAEIVSNDKKFCAGKAVLEKIVLTAKAAWGKFSFPVYFAYPCNQLKKHPAFIHINFRDSIPDIYQPTEELIDRGYATLTVCYKDVTSDNGDFEDGLAGVVYPGGMRDDKACGKIGLWAWAAMRVMDYALMREELDHAHISVVGHSRLGKTALLTGALDERFCCAFSNDSGCSGAALVRGNTGETVAKICDKFPYWFSKSYLRYANHEEEMPFDQHFLIAANFPHKVYVASAVEDLWACPKNELLAAIAATPFFEKEGRIGLVSDGLSLNVGDKSHQGEIGYHLRDGKHYLSRQDWNLYIDYLENNK